MRNPARPYRLGGEHFGEQLRGPQIGHKMIRAVHVPQPFPEPKAQSSGLQRQGMGGRSLEV